ncbi:MAG: MBL fold metallo-hydrolase [Spirochaetes bacterium]|nr:MBL fold metallo-hydrolase [Spirochaetota bacterium]
MITRTKITEHAELVTSDEMTPWKCNGLLVNTTGGFVMIDCNFKREEIRKLTDSLPGEILSYYVSHFHIDHVSNLHEIESLGIPVMIAESEKRYPLSMDTLIMDSGAVEMGTEGHMWSFVKDVSFREIQSVKTFVPGEIFTYGNTVIKAVPLPGHSPGHSGFIVCRDGERDILFGSDIGLDTFGPWYGFKYCDLHLYRKSIRELADIYRKGDYILTGSHSDIVREYRPELFTRIITMIDSTEDAILNDIESKGTVTLHDLVFKGLYYGISSIEKMNEMLKKLYYFWEYFTLKNQLDYMAIRGLIHEMPEGNYSLVKERNTCREEVCSQ